MKGTECTECFLVLFLMPHKVQDGSSLSVDQNLNCEKYRFPMVPLLYKVSLYSLEWMKS